MARRPIRVTPEMTAHPSDKTSNRTALRRGPPPGKATRGDVARAAGVSAAVVTYALNESGKLRVSDATRRRIKKIAERIGYRPRFMYRALVAGKTYSIGLVLPDERSLLFPFYELMIGGLVSAMNDDDHDPLLLFRTHWDRIDKVMEEGRVDGLVAIDSGTDDGFVERLAAGGRPLVVLNREVPRGLNPTVGCVYSHHERMLGEAVDALVADGRRRLLLVNSAGATFANACYERSFFKALANHARDGVSGEQCAPWDDQPSAPSVMRGTDGPRWDGVIANGDPAADAALAELGRLGRQPGRDVQVIAVNSYVASELYGPSQGSSRQGLWRMYRQPSRRLGVQAWRMMRQFLAGETPRRRCRVPYKLDS